MHTVIALFAMGGLLGWSGNALAANPGPGSRQTREFVEAAAQSDAFEVLEAQAVLIGTSDPGIRAFAQQMIHDHRETTQALEKATALSGLIPPPKGMSDDQAHFLGALQSVRGRDFDKAYLRQQVLAHNAAFMVEQMYAQSGDDPAVRHAAASATPLISSHLMMAKQMLAKLGDS